MSPIAVAFTLPESNVIRLPAATASERGQLSGWSKHAVRIDDPTPNDTPTTLIVVVAQQTGFGVEDQGSAWRP